MSAPRPVRTRMAPSPTGFMHVGTLRTVLYDYFLARQAGGQFLIRIEDTDQERFVPGALESLLRTMQTMGIDYDEGPILNTDGTLGEKGAYGPYVQSQRLATYQRYADQLLEAGHAYHCFCTSETLEELRRVQTETKQPLKYDRRCLRLSPEEVRTRLAALKPGDSHVIRLKVPEGSCSFVDGIRGTLTFQNADVEDFVLIKSNGFSAYHLAVVVDDRLMEISHVLRGEEWVSSTPKQIILHQMLGWEMPVYSHVPLLLNADKTKLSKRKGDVSVESYLAKGYVPAALTNFLALLGWNPTDNREMFTRDELVKLFDLSKVNRAGAVLNIEKLNWMNNQYLRTLPEEDYVALCLEKDWLSGEPWNKLLAEETGREMMKRAVLVIRERLERLSDLVQLMSDLQLSEEHLSYSEVALVWKKSTQAATQTYLKEARVYLEAKAASWFQDRAQVEADLRAWIAEHGWSNGDVLWPLRVALSGREKSPSPFDFLWMLQKDQALLRIDDALATLA